MDLKLKRSHWQSLPRVMGRWACFISIIYFLGIVLWQIHFCSELWMASCSKCNFFFCLWPFLDVLKQNSIVRNVVFCSQNPLTSLFPAVWSATSNCQSGGEKTLLVITTISVQLETFHFSTSVLNVCCGLRLSCFGDSKFTPVWLRIWQQDRRNKSLGGCSLKPDSD